MALPSDRSEKDAGFYPYQVPIDAYGSGGFRFADMSHKGSVLCLPSGMFAWAPQAAGDVTIDSLARILDASEDIDVCLVGLGSSIMPLSKSIRAAFAEKDIVLEMIGTGGAVRTYNVLMAEKRAVAGAFIAVERDPRPK